MTASPLCLSFHDTGACTMDAHVRLPSAQHGRSVDAQCVTASEEESKSRGGRKDKKKKEGRKDNNYGVKHFVFRVCFASRTWVVGGAAPLWNAGDEAGVACEKGCSPLINSTARTLVFPGRCCLDMLSELV